MRLREALRPYINTLYRQAATDGSPVIRSLRYVFPTDTAAADVDDQIMLGDRYLGGACTPPPHCNSQRIDPLATRCFECQLETHMTARLTDAM
jgi:hypothetical protein